MSIQISNRSQLAAMAISGVFLIGSLASVATAQSPGGRQKEPAGQTHPSPSKAKPWFAGTTLANRQKAARLDKEGNELLKRHLFAEAMGKYQEALQYWQHPRIHYHLTIVQIELGDDPLVTYRSAKTALRYDGAALTADERERARGYKKLLRRQLVEIEVACSQPGVQVKLGGKPLMNGPGVKRTLVKPGDYEITARKAGYIALNQTVQLWPEQKKRVDLKLFTLQDVSGTQRRWQRWKPWAVVGAGAAVAAVGGVLHWRAKVNIDKHDDLLKTIPECTQGCAPSHENSPEDILSRGYVQQKFAITGYLIGGTALAAGLTLALLNRPRAYRLDKSDEAFRVSVVPAVTPQAVGVSAGMSF
ncbi:MAG: PEGA domain-containing protein [Proteobacteria bacterium]|nr:PEGA domain-containing protein [Pseudomonadota bacterium]